MGHHHLEGGFPGAGGEALPVGADGIVVSNHGGRQLDGALSSIRMLPSIVRAVGGKTEVWLDSGIRSGQDVLKAVALGATGTMIGRSYIYGLGAMGQKGVTTALEVIRKDALEFCFREFAPYQGKCRFVGCSHTSEKGCAVLEAVRAGEIPESRHRNYCALYEEAKLLKEWDLREPGGAQ